MALVVEDGTGLSTAESYLSVADTTTYLTAHGREASWTAVATEAEQEEHLRNATRFLDARFRLRYTGRKYTLAQALQWPRSSATQDGFAIDSDVVPQAVKDAVAEAALRSVTETGGLLPDITSPGTLKAKTVKAGSVTVAKEWVAGSGSAPLFQIINGILAPVLSNPNEVVRG